MSNNLEKDLDKSTLFLILYLIEKLNGVLGRTHLQKLLFLSDLMSVKKFKEQLTKLEYQKYFYGPYSQEVKKYVDYLINSDLIEERVLSFIDDSTKKYARYYLKSKISFRDKVLEYFGPDKTILINEVIQSYGNIGLQSLLDIVYNLQLVKDTEICKPLKIAKEIKNSETDLVEDEVPF